LTSGEDSPRNNEEDRQIAMRGEHDVFRAGEQRRTDGDGFLAAADIDSAHDFPLPVELAFDAVFELAHHGHVIKTLVCQGGVGGALVGSVPCDGRDGAHWGYCIELRESDVRAGSAGSFGGQ